MIKIADRQICRLYLVRFIHLRVLEWQVVPEGIMQGAVDLAYEYGLYLPIRINNGRVGEVGGLVEIFVLMLGCWIEEGVENFVGDADVVQYLIDILAAGDLRYIQFAPNNIHHITLVDSEVK